MEILNREDIYIGKAVRDYLAQARERVAEALDKAYQQGNSSGVWSAIQAKPKHLKVWREIVTKELLP